MSDDIKVLCVLPGDRAIISTEGLFRVRTEDGGIIAELVPREDAELMSGTYNECMVNRPGMFAAIEPYAVGELVGGA